MHKATSEFPMPGFHLAVREAIEGLADDRDKQQKGLAGLRELHAQLLREWAAYLRRLAAR